MKTRIVNRRQSTVHSNLLFVKLIVLFFTIHYSLLTTHCYSQIGVNTTGALPNGSAALDVSGSTKGVLINRMNTAQRNAITTPAASLLIYNTDTKCFEAFINGGWYSVSCPSGCTPPAAPVTTAATNVACVSFTANWNASPSANAYYLDVAYDIAMTNFVSVYNNLYIGNVTSFNITGLTSNTNYYYRVRATTGCISSNSNIKQVTTINP